MRTFKPLFVFVILATLASLLLPVQAQGKGPDPVGLRPDAPEYAKHGPYWVGVREYVIPDKERKRPLPVTVWYPALNPDGKPEDITYKLNYPPMIEGLPVKGHALLDALADLSQGPYPLIVFSHGNWWFRLGYTYYTEHLASYGFVVIAVDHTGNTTANLGESQHLHNVLRPQDVIRVIDYAAALTKEGGAMKGQIDTNQVAVTGHSFGAWTALAAVGAQMNIKAYKSWCAANPLYDPYSLGLCTSFTDYESELAAVAGLKSVPDGLWPAIADSTVKAAVALAPGTTAVFGKEGIAPIKVPVMILAGTGDSFVPPQYHAYLAYDWLDNGKKALVSLENADHGVYTDPCSVTPWVNANGSLSRCSDDPVWDMNRAHDLINHIATAFLLDVLKGDKEAHKALLPDAVKFPGIQYKTTMK